MHTFSTASSAAAASSKVTNAKPLLRPVDESTATLHSRVRPYFAKMSSSSRSRVYILSGGRGECRAWAIRNWIIRASEYWLRAGARWAILGRMNVIIRADR